jgi:hypothetical protein
MRMIFRCCAVLIAMSWVGAAAPVQAAEENAQPSERELRTALNRAEKRFFDLYNRLNDDGRHEMSCENDGVVGSRLKKNRTCRTRGESAVGEEAAREYMRGLNMSADMAGAKSTDASDGPMGALGAPPVATAEYADSAISDARAKMQDERAAFDKHLTALLAKHPDLKARFDEYLLARSRHEAARSR